MNGVKVPPVFRQILKSVSLHGFKRITRLRDVIHAYDLSESGPAISDRRSTRSAE